MKFLKKLTTKYKNLLMLDIENGIEGFVLRNYRVWNEDSKQGNSSIKYGLFIILYTVVGIILMIFITAIVMSAAYLLISKITTLISIE